MCTLEHTMDISCVVAVMQESTAADLGAAAPAAATAAAAGAPPAAAASAPAAGAAAAAPPQLADLAALLAQGLQGKAGLFSPMRTTSFPAATPTATPACCCNAP